jgi:hypothetical protein
VDPVRFIAVIAGLALVISSFYWTAQVMMVRGAEPPYFARIMLRGARNLLHLASSIRPNPTRQHNLWALYVPFSLISIVVLSLIMACLGFALFIYGITSNSARLALENSISAMSVLGFAGLPPTLRETIVAGFEAFTGPIFVALLIGYIVNIYAAYSQQRDRVSDMDAKLEGNSSGLDLIENAAAGPGLDSLSVVWTAWADEFGDIEHRYRTVDGYLLIFAPVMTKHWSTDAVMVFDAANLRNTLVALPPDSEAARCLDVGSVAIGHIANHYGHRIYSFRRPQEPRTITLQEFERCASRLRGLGVPIAADVLGAWEKFGQMRESYAPATYRLQRMQSAALAV